jgi:HlyD family secretion protein
MKRLLILALLALACCDDTPRDPPYLGYVEGERLSVGAPEGGWIEEVFVAEGDEVQIGKLLFRLDSKRETSQRDAARARLAQAQSQLANLLTGKRADEIRVLEAQIEAGRASLELARHERARQEGLANSPALNPKALDQARAAHESERAKLTELEAQLRVGKLPARPDEIAAARAQAQAAAAELAEAEVRLADRTIAARVGGRAERLVRRTGELAPVGGAVVTLLPPEGVHVRLYVPEPDLARIRIGSRFSVRCDGCAGDVTATVFFVAGESEFTPPVLYAVESRKKLVYLVKAKPAAPGLKPGQPIEARLLP